MKEELKKMAQKGIIPFDISFIRDEKPIAVIVAKNTAKKKTVEVRGFYKAISRMT